MLPHSGDRTTAATNPNPAALEGRDSGEGGRPGGGEAGGWFRGPGDGRGDRARSERGAMADAGGGRGRRRSPRAVGSRQSFAAAAARGRWEVVEAGHSCGQLRGAAGEEAPGREKMARSGEQEE